MDAGAKARDLEVAIDRAKRIGATWIAPRAGDVTRNDAQFDRASCEAYANAGLAVYPWLFVRPGRNAQTVAACASMRDWPGVAGVILNAEFEYQGAQPAEAKALVASLRAAGFDFVAHAPPDYLGGRGSSPAFVALDEVCDAIMPQVYAWEHDDSGHVRHLDNVASLYAKRGIGADRCWPILCTYRPKVRGFDAAGKAKPTPPMANEARRVAADLLEGLAHPWVRASRAPSLYSLDAISFITGPSDEVISALEDRHRLTLPLPDDDTGWRPKHDAREFIEDELGFVVDSTKEDS